MPTIKSRPFKGVADNPPQGVALSQIHNQWKIHSVSVGGIKLRAGVFPSNKDIPLKANVLYLEGLADSMFNHNQLINTLSKAGYQVIAFDYPGQGGSEGNMNQTRITENQLSYDSIHDLFKKDQFENNDFDELMNTLKEHKLESSSSYLIKDLADKIWTEIKTANNIDSKKLLDVAIGWSTGGIAAYDMAKDQKKGIKAVVLIAPATNPNTIPVIKIKTETLNGNINFKHLDNIRPDSPGKVPNFTLNLLASGLASQNWEVANDVKGLVLLSDQENDKYVDSKKVELTLKKNASHFKCINYKGAAHEIDNETKEHRTDKQGELLENSVVQFLDNIFL